MEEKKMEYLSDEELEKLILDVETNHMMQAPSYLKKEILVQSQQTLRPVQSVQLTQKRKRKLLFYQMKVGVAAAAAIVTLFLLPNVENKIPQKEPSKSITSRLSETSGTLCESMNRISDLLIFKK